jgi:alpha-D-ribose 1-methylphosphonate 5-triphosphate synthase subunit PhnG
MTHHTSAADWPPARNQWLRYWSALPAEQAETLATNIAGQCTVKDLTLPQSGLGLLKLPDSALNDLYFLGEVPVSHAHVEVVTDDGRRSEGGARLLDDRQSLAWALAVLDATLAARLPDHEQALDLLRAGMAKVQETERERHAMLAATRVDFSLLGDGSEDDNE